MRRYSRTFLCGALRVEKVERLRADGAEKGERKIARLKATATEAMADEQRDRGAAAIVS
jgi:hypothetical protein